jgi:hypothetical protein
MRMVGALPIACTLTPDALRARKGLLADLLRRAETQELAGEGVRLRFAADAGTLLAIAQVVEAERGCCRFLRFAITVDPDEGPIVLELSGPAGTRDFLASLLHV